MPSQFTYKPTSFSSQNRSKNTPVFQSDSSGKEKDSETGYYYFGARYYNPDLSLWLSVDPMSDKYPSLSPYNYCAWNPIRIIDPDGNDWYDLLKDGTIVRNADKSKDYQEKDVIFSKQTGRLSQEYDLGTISGIKHNDIINYEVKNGEEITTKTAMGQRFTIFGDANTAKDIFEFCASNSPYIEYSLIEAADNISYMATSRSRIGDEYGTALGLTLAMKGKFLSHTHNHPGKSSEFSDGDISFYNSATKYIQKATQSDFRPTFKLFIFIDKVKGGEYYDYKFN